MNIMVLLMGIAAMERQFGPQTLFLFKDGNYLYLMPVQRIEGCWHLVAANDGQS